MTESSTDEQRAHIRKIAEEAEASNHGVCISDYDERRADCRSHTHHGERTMTRRITVAERDPEWGDELFFRGKILAVRRISHRYGYAEVWDNVGLHRLGLSLLRGFTAVLSADLRGCWGEWPGYERYALTGQTKSGMAMPETFILWDMAPARYRSRADGGRVDWPIDGGIYTGGSISECLKAAACLSIQVEETTENHNA